jgi:hypothetical protein
MICLMLSEQMGKKRGTKNPHAVALGRLGGLKGGKARFSKMSPEEKRELARRAALARWSKHRKSKPQGGRELG